MSGIVPWAGRATYAPSFAPSVPTAPVSAQPSLRDWWRELQAQEEKSPPTTRVESAVMGLRHHGESAVMGALLALVDTDLGGLDLGGRVPLDWVGAALFYILSIRDKEEGIASDLRAMGQSCTTVAMYRMVQKWRCAQKSIPQNKTSKDPVFNAGKAF